MIIEIYYLNQDIKSVTPPSVELFHMQELPQLYLKLSLSVCNELINKFKHNYLRSKVPVKHITIIKKLAKCLKGLTLKSK